MASELQRVAQALVECLDQVPQLVEYLQRLAQRCRDNAGYLADISNHPAARNAALELDMAARCCDDAAHLLSLTPLQARAWAMEMVGGPGATSVHDGRSSTGPSVPGCSSVSKAKAGGSNPAASALTPTQVTELLARLPKRDKKPGHRDKTRGTWIDREGNAIELASGVDPCREQADAFARANRLGDPPHKLVITSHVEVKFAMLMRERNLRDETIVINNRPCRGEAGCDAMLADFLPPDATLTVYAPDGFKKTYRGRSAPQ